MYKVLLKYYIRRNSPAKAFAIAMDILAAIRRIPFGRPFVRLRYRNRIRTDRNLELFGLEFANPVGLAASIDSGGVFYNSLSDFGFSFIEIGPMSYVEQDYSTPAKHYLGVKKAIEHLRSDRPDCLISANIIRNAQSRGAEIIRDFENAFALLYDFVDMIVINPRCNAAEEPDSGNGDDDTDRMSELPEIIDRILAMRLYYDANKPVLVRLTSETTRAQTDEIVEYCLSSGIDGVVAGSTLRHDDDKDGSELFNRNLNFIRHISEKSRGLLPIIGVGGVMDSVRAQKMLDAGASMLEVYTGLFREGPSIVKDIVNNLPGNKSGIASAGSGRNQEVCQEVETEEK